MRTKDARANPKDNQGEGKFDNIPKAAIHATKLAYSLATFTVYGNYTRRFIGTLEVRFDLEQIRPRSEASETKLLSVLTPSGQRLLHAQMDEGKLTSLLEFVRPTRHRDWVTDLEATYRFDTKVLELAKKQFIARVIESIQLSDEALKKIEAAGGKLPPLRHDYPMTVHLGLSNAAAWRVKADARDPAVSDVDVGRFLR